MEEKQRISKRAKPTKKQGSSIKQAINRQNFVL
jgi:hypothetical protein